MRCAVASPWWLVRREAQDAASPPRSARRVPPSSARAAAAGPAHAALRLRASLRDDRGDRRARHGARWSGIPFAVDHLDKAQVANLAERIRAGYGHIDVLVNDIWG